MLDNIYIMLAISLVTVSLFIFFFPYMFLKELITYKVKTVNLDFHIKNTNFQRFIEIHPYGRNQFSSPVLFWASFWFLSVSWSFVFSLNKLSDVLSTLAHPRSIFLVRWMLLSLSREIIWFISQGAQIVTDFLC